MNLRDNRIIPSSQLIINEDGSAFHIHLRPDQLRDNIILVGDPGRVDIEIVITELDALANVDFKTRTVKAEHRTLNMVRIGTSGSLQEDIHIGDFVIAEKALGFDGILNFYADRDKVCDLEFEREFRRHMKWPQTWAAPYIVDAAPALVDAIGRDDMLRGYTIASVGFYAPQGRMLGHNAMTVCCIIAERRAENADTDYKPHVKRLVETVLNRMHDYHSLNG